MLGELSAESIIAFVTAFYDKDRRDVHTKICILLPNDPTPEMTIFLREPRMKVRILFSSSQNVVLLSFNDDNNNKIANGYIFEWISVEIDRYYRSSSSEESKSWLVFVVFRVQKFQMCTKFENSVSIIDIEW